ncbi:MAG TPA: response regulator [Verrucomicrobiae bacterium]|jgi:CheY-like chemotaxis protein|nr:response regulator [Verrucomicrobiae bacterium]
MLFRRKKVAQVAPVPVPATKTESQEAGEARKRILVVDDDPIIVKTLTLTLNARGYDVLSAGDAAEAIGKMRDEKPDMLLVDVSLPADCASGGVVPWNGFQITQWLQRMSTAKIPTIIISGTDKPEYKAKAAAVGAEAFMAKPLDNAMLLGSIASALANCESGTEFVSLKMASCEERIANDGRHGGK